MSQIKEYDYLLNGSPYEEVVIHDDLGAMGQRVAEWLDTPEGTVADMPGWGHPFYLFKHEPESDDLNVMAEMALYEKLTTDIKDLDLRGVSVSFSEIDRMDVAIKIGESILKKQVDL